MTRLLDTKTASQLLINIFGTVAQKGKHVLNNLLLFVMSTWHDRSDYLNESIKCNAIWAGWGCWWPIVQLGELHSKADEISASPSLVQWRWFGSWRSRWTRSVLRQPAWFRTWYLVTLAGSDLLPDPLERAQMDFEVQKFVTSCFSLNLLRKE